MPADIYWDHQDHIVTERQQTKSHRRTGVGNTETTENRPAAHIFGLI